MNEKNNFPIKRTPQLWLNSLRYFSVDFYTEELGDRWNDTEMWIRVKCFRCDKSVYVKKTKQVNIPASNMSNEKDPSTVSIAELKELSEQKIPKSNRKSKNGSSKNTISLDL